LSQDNEQRKIQEEKAAARRKQQEMMKSEKKSGKLFSILLSIGPRGPNRRLIGSCAEYSA